MPGVSIQTAVRVGPAAATSIETSQAFFVGKAERGPVTSAKLVTSLSEFEALYGGYHTGSYLHPSVETFFEEGGTRAYISRVVGPTTTTGVRTLDTTAGAGGTNVMTITANGPGAWSTDITVQCVNPGTVAGTFIIKIFDAGTLLMSTGNCTTVAQAVGRINANAAASKRVIASDLGAAGLPHDDASPVALSAGTADEANITNDEHNAALTDFLESYGTGVVMNVETDATAVQTALANHANNYSRIAFLYGGSADTVADAKADGNALAGANVNTEHVAYYYPWVYVPTGVTGVNRLIPPVAYAAGKRAVSHVQVGAHRPGAGLISVASFVNGVAVDIDKSTGDALDEAYVNAIRVINNTIRIYGARSLSSDTSNFRFITAQDVVNQIVVDANRSLEDLIFSVIDGRNTIFTAVESKLLAILEPLRQSGALFEAFDVNGKRIDYGYTVKCDSALNPTAQLADGLVKARVGVRVSGVGDKIEIDIVKSNLTKSVV